MGPDFEPQVEDEESFPEPIDELLIENEGIVNLDIKVYPGMENAN